MTIVSWPQGVEWVYIKKEPGWVALPFSYLFCQTNKYKTVKKKNIVGALQQVLSHIFVNVFVL